MGPKRWRLQDMQRIMCMDIAHVHGWRGELSHVGPRAHGFREGTARGRMGSARGTGRSRARKARVAAARPEDYLVPRQAEPSWVEDIR